jgi:TM2 domain-containing membrane protein YozV
MQRKIFLLLIGSFFILKSVKACNTEGSPAPSLRQCFLQHPENVRRTAILLDLSLGFFGVHRMYLGTSPKVPVFYTLSMGGGGVLWLVDLGVLIAHKDITPYLNNPRMLMWSEKATVLLPSVGQ